MEEKSSLSAQDERDVGDHRQDTGDERDKKAPGPEYVVTLIHGTFAPNAPWMANGSPLCQAVSTLSDGGVLFQPFQWEGKWLRRYNNTHGARHAASLKLRTELRATLERYPNARHFVIAHSHGGNIALQALRDSELNAGLQGVACLATPFLKGDRNKPEKYITSLAEAVGMLGWLTYIFLYLHVTKATGKFFTFVPAFLSLFLPNAAIDVLGRVVYFAGLVGGAFAVWRWLPRWLTTVVAPKLVARQDQIVDRHHLPDLGDLPIFTAKAKGDEAIGGLRTVRWLEKALAKCCHGFVYLLVFGLLLTCGVVVAMQTGEMSGSVSSFSLLNVSVLILLGELLFLVMFFSLVALVLPVIFLWPFAVQIAMSVPRFISFGWEGVVDSWLFRGEVATLPDYPGSRLVEREYQFGRAYNSSKRWFRHSDICNQPEVIKDLVAWMRQTVR